MTNNLILRVEYLGVVYDLPVDSSVPLRVDMSTVENQEIGNTFGIGSQTFDLPGTKEVNRFFNYAYDVSIDDVPAMYNTLPCSVILNGETLIDGQLQLQEVVTSEDGYVGYKVLVTDSTIQFKDAIADKLLRDLNLSAYTHTLSTGFITGSWRDNRGTAEGDPPLDGAVFYPLCDFGTDNVIPFPDQPKVMPAPFAQTGSINFLGTPMLLKQFQPAIRVPELLDAVFEQAGFSYVSTFVDDECNNMYVLPKAQEALGPYLSISEDVEVTNTAQFINPIGAGSEYSASLHYNVELKDQSGNYDPLTYTFTAPTTARYTINWGIAFPNVGQEPGVLIGYTLRLLKNGVLLENAYSPAYGTTSAGSYVLVQKEIQNNMLAGETLTVEWRITNFSGTLPTRSGFTVTNNGVFNILSAQVYDGATIEMAAQFDPQVKTIDLVKGLMEQFNLVLVPEPNQPKVIRIETFDKWIRDGEIKDWTWRYDTAKRISINHTVDEQPKQILFKNQDDNDRISKVYLNGNPGYQFGSVRVLADNNISQGEKEIGTFFAPIALAPMVSSSVYRNTSENQTDIFTNDFTEYENLVPHLYKFDNNQQTAYKFKPRIGYKSTGFGVFNGEDPTQFFIEDNGGALGLESYSTLTNVEFVNPGYPYYFISSINYIEGKDINFNTDVSYIPARYLTYSTGSSNYSNYWETYIESLYWEGSKKVTLDLYFEPYEYKDIKLNDKIIIKNQTYRINKISGFNVSHRDVVTVELIKLYPEYITGNIIPPTPTPTPTPSPSPTPTPTPTGPTPTPTPTPTGTPGCYTYSVSNNSFADTLYYRYYECDCTTLVENQVVLPDSQTPDFCACSGSVERQGGSLAYVINEEDPICTL